MLDLLARIERREKKLDKWLPPPRKKPNLLKRSRLIEQAYQRGGQLFLDAVRDRGCTYKHDQPLQLTNWLEEVCLLIGDLRIAHTYTTGPAQCGKTLSHSMLLAWLVSELRLDSGWFYAERSSMDANVPDQFRPLSEQWVDRLEEGGRTIRNEGDRKINERYQFGGVTAIFSYASTSRATQSRTGKAAAAGAGVSFTAHALFYEEKSQWPSGIDFSPRLEASLLPTKPIRELGTPGGGSGIEAGMAALDRYFYPHYECPNCGAVKPLDAKGCVLRLMAKRLPNGKVESTYLSPAGRPIDKGEVLTNGNIAAGWWHKNPESPIDSAYIACSECGHELSEETRLNAHMRCLQTGESARDYVAALPVGIPDKKLRIAIHLSPLTKATAYNQAAEIINKGLGHSAESSNADDWQQQILGHPSESSAANVTAQMIDACIAAPKPTRAPDVVLAGCDQGRGEDWLWIARIFLPPDWRSLSVPQVAERAIRSVVFAGDVARDEVVQIARTYGVKLGAYDNEPDIEAIAELCDRSMFQMLDQRRQSDMLKLSKVRSGRKEYDCWFVNNNEFQNRVMVGFTAADEEGYPLYRFPESWRRWRAMQNAEKSPYRHLTAMRRDAETRQWKRPNDHVDDLWFAAMDCEVALQLWVEQASRARAGGMSLGSYG